MEFLSKAKGIINKSGTDYYPPENVSDGSTNENIESILFKWVEDIENRVEALEGAEPVTNPGLIILEIKNNKTTYLDKVVGSEHIAGILAEGMSVVLYIGSGMFAQLTYCEANYGATFVFLEDKGKGTIYYTSKFVAVDGTVTTLTNELEYTPADSNS